VDMSGSGFDSAYVTTLDIA